MGNVSAIPSEWEQFISPLSPLVSPRSARAVTKSDTADLPQYSRWLYIGGSGNINVIMADDDGSVNPPVIFAVTAGQFLQLSIRRLMSTSTTATDVIALF